MNMARIKRDPKKVALAQAILEAYNPESVEDMNDTLKDLFGPLFLSLIHISWLLIYFDDIFSNENISKFCRKNNIKIKDFNVLFNELERFAKNTHTLGCLLYTSYLKGGK